MPHRSAGSATASAEAASVTSVSRSGEKMVRWNRRSASAIASGISAAPRSSRLSQLASVVLSSAQVVGSEGIRFPRHWIWKDQIEGLVVESVSHAHKAACSARHLS